MKIKIEDIGYNGEGIGRQDGKVCFVPFTLPEEIVNAEIIKQNKDFCNCKVEQIELKSEHRIQPFCPYFSSCGGCNLQHMTKNFECKYKEDLIRKTFKKIAKKEIQIKNIIYENQKVCRNKIAFSVKNEKDYIEIGLLENASHKIVDINNCSIISEKMNYFYKIIKNYIKNYNFIELLYMNNIKLKHIVLREIGDFISIVFVFDKKLKIDFSDLVNSLPKPFSIDVEINKNSNTILSENVFHVIGETKVKNTCLGINYYLSPNSFSQVNEKIKEKLYVQVLNNLSQKNVVDCYSGAGLLTALVSKKVDKVYGVEICKEATEDSNFLMQQNNINNVENFCGDAKNILPILLQKNNKPLELILDPARSGVERDLICIINSQKNIKQIQYISCNPATLCRDIALLTNYEIISVQPFDMFPFTSNVETLVVLKHNNQ